MFNMLDLASQTSFPYPRFDRLATTVALQPLYPLCVNTGAMYPATTTSLRALRGARRLVHLRPLALISTTFINTHRPVHLRQSGALMAAAPSSFSTSSTSAANPPANSGRTDDEPQVCIHGLSCLETSLFVRHRPYRLSPLALPTPCLRSARLPVPPL